MTTRNRTPSILDSYLRLPPELSLTLLTSTLSCSATWLAARFVATALKQDEQPLRTIIVSWMRDELFWRFEIKRTTNINIDKPGTFIFIDRLAESLLPARNDKDELQDLVTKVIKSAEQQNVKALVVFDVPELLLTIRPELQVSQLNNALLKIRSHSQVHSALMLCMADPPCLTAEQRPPLELAIASFIIQQAHMARLIFSVRELTTGSARDVSGLLRITNNSEDDELKELERRYLVQRDGAVKMD